MTAPRKRGPKPTPLQRGDVIKTHPRGDVIKTHPRDGFWGCAVVLTEPHQQQGFRPFCHIGITPLVFTRDYEWAEIADTELSILQFDRGVRIGPNTYVPRHETCIGQYTTDPHPLLPVIGTVDAARVFTPPLTPEVGDGTEGKYPLCGPIKPHLGSEAVGSWLRVHDPSRWQAEQEAARERYEALSARIKNEERQKRRARRMRKGGA